MSNQTEQKNIFNPLLTKKASITASGLWYEKKLIKTWVGLTPQERADHQNVLEAEYEKTVAQLQRLRTERACVLHANHYLALQANIPHAASNRPVITTPSLDWVETNLYNNRGCK